jgi:hypothetical protein
MKGGKQPSNLAAASEFFDPNAVTPGRRFEWLDLPETGIARSGLHSGGAYGRSCRIIGKPHHSYRDKPLSTNGDLP